MGEGGGLDSEESENVEEGEKHDCDGDVEVGEGGKRGFYGGVVLEELRTVSGRVRQRHAVTNGVAGSGYCLRGRHGEAWKAWNMKDRGQPRMPSVKLCEPRARRGLEGKAAEGRAWLRVHGALQLVGSRIRRTGLVS